MFNYIWQTKPAIKVPDYKIHNLFDAVMPLVWEEHCLECAAPYCYSTCMIYKSRADKRCLRFLHGVIPVYFEDLEIPGAEITFRRWAKLQTHLHRNFGGIKLTRFKKYLWLNNLARILEKLIHNIPWRKFRISRVLANVGSILLYKNYQKADSSLDGFLAIIYNHETSMQSLICEIVDDNRSLYKHTLLLKPGWNEEFIPISVFPLFENSNLLFRIYSDANKSVTFTFKVLDFVSLIKDNKKDQLLVPADKVKCVAWDLDNTLWHGVIGDDGPEGVILNEKCLQLIKEFDQRGIIQTIVSKNNFDIAWDKIKKSGLNNYFLYPAINWGRKSTNIKQIAKELNINVDTFAIIDDSVFERNEIKTHLNQVRVYDIIDIDNILNRPEFDIPITIESAHRRQSYLNEYKRKRIQASWAGDYDSFLKECNMQMRIFTPTQKEEKARCLELLLRSNQYNISKTKKSKDDYIEIINNTNNNIFAFSLKDNYGDYGIVGFASFRCEKEYYYLTDFVMSCRVAQKKVERAFFNYVFNEKLRDAQGFVIELFKTDRNAPLQKVLREMPFSEKEETDEKMYLLYKKERKYFLLDEIIKIY